MASSLLLDTSGWLTLLNSGDAAHLEAEKRWRDLIGRGAQIILSDWIVAETGNGSARSRHRHQFSAAAQATVNDARVDRVVVEKDLLDHSLELFGRHADKTWGLVDCASFLIMRDRGITDAFTSDRHFEQAGFNCLLDV